LVAVLPEIFRVETTQLRPSAVGSLSNPNS
jgi:hypothetical protein